MAEEATTVVAAPSAAATAPAVIELPRSGTPEYAQWRLSGELPEAKVEKTAGAAPSAADTSKEADAEDAAHSAATNTQEKPDKRSAEARIKELAAESKRLKQELEEARRPKETKTAESSAAKAEPSDSRQPQSYAEWRKGFKPKEWIAKYSADHPGASYEEAYSALADMQYDVRRNFEQAEQARASAMQKAADVRAQAAELYPDFEEVATPMADKVLALIQDPQVDAVLKRAILDPEGFHILYALGKDAKIAEEFGKLALADPAEAIYLWKNLKAEVRAELAKGKTDAAGRNGNGQFAAAAESKTETRGTPAKRSPESAPPPPLEIGARGAGPANASDQALSKIAEGDPRAFAAWKRAEDAKELRRRRGA